MRVIIEKLMSSTDTVYKIYHLIFNLEKLYNAAKLVKTPQKAKSKGNLKPAKLFNSAKIYTAKLAEHKNLNSQQVLAR